VLKEINFILHQAIVWIPENAHSVELILNTSRDDSITLPHDSNETWDDYKSKSDPHKFHWQL
jgi:hypothetical protein